jgi:hypothetical protein
MMSSNRMTELSKNTLRSYTSSLRKIQDALDDDYTAQQAVEYLEKEVPNPNSRRVYLSALLWHYKEGDSYGVVRKAFDKARLEANQQTKKQELPEARKEKFLSWDEVLKAYEKADEEYKAGRITLEQFVLLSCYVLTPPVRADYAEMEIVKRYPKQQEKKNYAVLRKTKPVFIFNDYKTAGTYGSVELPIPKPLAGLLTGLSATQNVVFKGNRNTLSHALRNLFIQLTGKATGIGLLRHAYITKFYESNPSIAQKERVANQMLHSYTTGEMYREVEGEGEGGDT